MLRPVGGLTGHTAWKTGAEAVFRLRHEAISHLHRASARGEGVAGQLRQCQAIVRHLRAGPRGQAGFAANSLGDDGGRQASAEDLHQALRSGTRG